MSSQDKNWEDMLAKALEYQQDFYELLPAWTSYKINQIKYLKQNVGYAIFGAPLCEKNSNSDSSEILYYRTDNIHNDTEISNLVHYESKQAKEMISLITDKICKYGRAPVSNTIKCGIIYLIIMDVQCKNDIKGHIALPLFKIMKYNDNCKVSTQKSKKNTNMYTTWYIDIKGRVYKGWDHYMKTNDLPECTVVYPKDGFYQPNPAFSTTPNQSTVWVITQDSLACSERAKVFSTINKAVNTIGAAAGIGLGVASLVTPVGPTVVTAGLVTSSLSGVWNIGKCTADLVDRSAHNESISPLDKSALSSWLGIAGCTVGIAANGGSILLKQAAKSGINVCNIAKTTYNAAVISNISINLIGIGYQGFNIYKKYRETGKVDMQDIMYFGTHLLFFAGSITNIKFANEIIEITQGEILREFEENLRSDNLRKRYDIVQYNAKETYKMDQIGQNAEIIRYINEVNINTNHVSNMQPVNSPSSLSNLLMVQQYKLKLYGITLIDPILFIADFAKTYVSQTINKRECEPNSHSTDQSRKLMKVVERLLSDLYTSRDCPSNQELLSIPDFKIFVNDLKNVENAEHILPLIFDFALNLVKAENKYAYLVEACRFLWDYMKKHMREAGFKIVSNIEYMQDIFAALYDAVDSMMHRFLNALHQYINLTKKQNV